MSEPMTPERLEILRNVALDEGLDELVEYLDRLAAERDRLAGMLDCRAGKLLRKGKPFVVVANDEPYYMAVYGMIRDREITIGRWSDEDERCFREAAKAGEGER